MAVNQKPFLLLTEKITSKTTRLFFLLRMIQSPKINNHRNILLGIIVKTNGIICYRTLNMKYISKNEDRFDYKSN